MENSFCGTQNEFIFVYFHFDHFKHYAKHHLRCSTEYSCGLGPTESLRVSENRFVIFEMTVSLNVQSDIWKLSFVIGV